MEISFSKHAQDRLEERGITERNVYTVLADPDAIISLPGARERMLYRKSMGSCTLEIIAVLEHNLTTVITAYYRSRQ